VSEVIDIDEATGADPLDQLRTAARKSIESKGAAAPGASERKFAPREITFPLELCDVYTGQVLRSFRVTSRVMDGPESAQSIRYATALAGVPMDHLDTADANWFKALARCETQTRAVSGTGFAPSMNAEQRLKSFFALLWEDPDVLAVVQRRLVEHEARFRLGEPPEGQGEARFPRVVVPSLDAAIRTAAAG
jgi:hypothetical protein